MEWRRSPAAPGLGSSNWEHKGSGPYPTAGLDGHNRHRCLPVSATISQIPEVSLEGEVLESQCSQGIYKAAKTSGYTAEPDIHDGDEKQIGESVQVSLSTLSRLIEP